MSFAVMYFQINFMSSINMHAGLMVPAEQGAEGEDGLAFPPGTRLGRTIHEELHAVERETVRRSLRRASVVTAQEDCALLAWQARMRCGEREDEDREAEAPSTGGHNSMMFKKRRGTCRGEEKQGGSNGASFTTLGDVGMGSLGGNDL